MTPASAFLKSRGISFTAHTYSEAMPLIVLMHGDRKVSTKNLARQAGRKSLEPCRPVEVAFED
jgi:hypothetical protein